MSKLKKTLAITILVCLLFSISSFANTSSVEYLKESEVLNDLGLYNGVSTTHFDPDLTRMVNREFGIVLFMRLFGFQFQVENLTDEESNHLLSKFEDSHAISGWARKSIACAVKNGIIKGVSPTVLGITLPLTGKMYGIMILNKLGYELTPELLDDPAKMLQMAKEANLDPADALKFFNDKPVNKDKVVGMSHKALSLKGKKGTTIIEELLSSNFVKAEKAFNNGFISQDKYENYKPKYKAQYLKEFRRLYSSGIFKGVNRRSLTKNLDAQVSMEDGIVLIVRMLNLREDASKLTTEEVTQILSKYEDNDKVTPASSKFVAYAIKEGLYKPTSNTLNLSESLSGKGYIKMIASQLGFGSLNADPQTIMKVQQILTKAGVDPMQFLKFANDAPLNKDALYGLSYKIYNILKTQGDSLIEEVRSEI